MTGDDVSLVQAMAQGETHALESLYVRYGLRILAYLVGQLGDRSLAEEVLQDVMLAVWQGASSYRGESSVYTWMLAIARKRAISARRQQKPSSMPLNEETLSNSAGPLEILEYQGEQEALRAALQQLSDDQRETLELIFYHHLSGPEAAAVIGVAPGTIKSRLHRAKEILYTLLREKNDA